MIENMIQALPQFKNGNIEYYQEGNQYFLYSPDAIGAFFYPRLASAFETLGYTCFCMTKNERVELIIY